MRHYYDVHCLLNHPDVQAFIGTEAYAARKKERFRSGDEPDLTRNPAFTLADPEIRAKFEAEYRKTAALYFRGQVSLADILERIARHLRRL